MSLTKYLQEKIGSLNEDQLDGFNQMLTAIRLTLAYPTGTGKGYLMIADLLNRILTTKGKVFAIASHRLMLNTQHTSDILKDLMPLTGKIGYIFVGSIAYNTANLQNIVEFNTRLNKLHIGYNDIISSTISPIELNKLVASHIKEGRKVVIITTYHSLMKLGAIDIDTFYCDEAHTLATEGQQALFMTNFKLVSANRYFFFTATPKDCIDPDTDAFLMNNKHVFGERIGMTFATAVAKGYIVSPVIHLVRPSDFEEGVDFNFNIKDKVKFIQEAFYAHKEYMKSRSVNPDRLGAKILVKCSSVTDEMWPLYAELVGTMRNVKIFAGASVENMEGYNVQGKHYMDDKQINKRDVYLKSMQDMTSEEDAIVLHFDILSEGINVAGFTGIMFLSGLLLTITKILQNIGRTTRLHSIDRLNLLKGLISAEDYSKWVKPCCAIIIPYWNDESNATRRLMSRIFRELRDRYDFEAKLEVYLGDDKGKTKKNPDIDPSLIEEELLLKDAIVDDIEHEIENQRFEIEDAHECGRVDKLSDDDYFDEVYNSLK